jgi:hypothetical protein
VVGVPGFAAEAASLASRPRRQEEPKATRRRCRQARVRRLPSLTYAARRGPLDAERGRRAGVRASGRAPSAGSNAGTAIPSPSFVRSRSSSRCSCGERSPDQFAQKRAQPVRCTNTAQKTGRSEGRSEARRSLTPFLNVRGSRRDLATTSGLITDFVTESETADAVARQYDSRAPFCFTSAEAGDVRTLRGRGRSAA